MVQSTSSSVKSGSTHLNPTTAQGSFPVNHKSILPRIQLRSTPQEWTDYGLFKSSSYFEFQGLYRLCVNHSSEREEYESLVGKLKLSKSSLKSYLPIQSRSKTMGSFFLGDHESDTHSLSWGEKKIGKRNVVSSLMLGYGVSYLGQRLI